MKIALIVVLAAAAVLAAARLAVRALQQEAERELARLLVTETEEYLRAAALA